MGPSEPTEQPATGSSPPDPAPPPHDTRGRESSLRGAWIIGGAIVAAGVLVAIALILTSQNDESPSQDRSPPVIQAGYSEEFRTAFMDSCVSSSGGQTAYCQCALDHLEANGPEDEGAITAADQQEAIEACQHLVT